MRIENHKIINLEKVLAMTRKISRIFIVSAALVIALSSCSTGISSEKNNLSSQTSSTDRQIATSTVLSTDIASMISTENSGDEVVSNSSNSSNISSGIVNKSTTSKSPSITPKPTTKPQITSTANSQLPTNIVFNDAVLENLIRQCLNKPTGHVTTKDWEKLGYDAIYIRPHRVENITVIELYDSNLIKSYAVKEITGLISNYAVLEQLPNIKFLDIIFISEQPGATNMKIDMSQICDIKGLESLSIFLTTSHHNEITQKFEFINFNNLTKLNTLTSLTLNTATNVDFKAVTNLKNLNTLDVYDCEITDVSTISNLTLLKTFKAAYNNITDGTGILGLKVLKEIDLNFNPIFSNTTFTNQLKQKFPGIDIKNYQ